jgi:GT2 family glycosyltransferase
MHDSDKSTPAPGSRADFPDPFILTAELGEQFLAHQYRGARHALYAEKRAARIALLEGRLAGRDRRIVQLERELRRHRQQSGAVGVFVYGALQRARRMLEGAAPGPLRARLNQVAGRYVRYLGSRRAKGNVNGEAENAQASQPSGEFTPITFPRPEQPDVSIIVPVFNKAAFTYECLKSIAESETEGPDVEVIIVDDSSTDETQEMLKAIDGPRVLVNPENLGFLRSCNRGASVASGRYIVFLNNDTKVRPGWLDALIRVADRDPSVGIVGAKLVYPNGTLQEAGAIIWRDATGWNYGRGDDPDQSEYCYVRETDYCSGACLLVRRDLFERAGGFDERFAPAYYEDTDLAFTARALGYKVLYQPDAIVEHVEGASHGTDISTGGKRHQEVNRHAFLDKWRKVLDEQHPRTTDVLVARERRRPLVLVFGRKVPAYDQDSGSLRMYQVLKLLSQMGYAVTFIPSSMTRVDPYTGCLAQLGVEVMYGMSDVLDHLRRIGSEIEVCILSSPAVAQLYLGVVRKYAPTATVLYDAVDLLYLREQRRVAIEDDPAGTLNAERSELLEIALARAADGTIAITEDEKSILARAVPEASLYVLPNIHEVREATPPYSQRRDILFVGSFAHPPNSDAVRYFVREIWPLIKRTLPEVRFHIIGADGGEEVRALASDDVEVVGWVQDLKPWFDRVRVSVGPLRFGAGMKGKIGESMAAGVPVVGTGIAVEGMDLEEGRTVLVADDPATFAEKVVRLYQDEALWNTLSEQAAKHVEAKFSPRVVAEVLREIMDHALSVPKKPPRE